MKRRHREMQPLTEMNVTNLLDTAFVLLMAFMIVAPSIKNGLKLDLPEANGEALDADKPYTISIARSETPDGTPQVMAGGQRVEISDLRALLEKEKVNSPKIDVTLEIDREISYETVMQTISAVKAAGIEVIDLPTDPPAN